MNAAAWKLTVVLASRLDPSKYAEKYLVGDGPDLHPYGLEKLPEDCLLTLTRSSERSRVPVRIRRFLVRKFAADLVHAWRNRRAILSADAVYAHTEHEYLGAAGVLLLYRNRRVVLSGQTIWLWEDLDEFGPVARAVVMRLLQRVDVFVYNSEWNYAEGKRLLPERRHEYVRFGVSERFRAVQSATARTPPLVLSVGIDRARDWTTLARALTGIDADVRVAARAVLPGFSAAQVQPTDHFRELLDLYADATCVVVSVRPNLHASGITTMLEAAAAGTPVICSKTGGVEEYFTDREVVFVPPEDEMALHAAITSTLADAELRLRLAATARTAFDAGDMNSSGHWRRVCAILRPTVCQRRRSAALPS